MADEQEEVQAEVDEPSQEAPAASSGFTIGKLIEWLLSNMIIVIISVVLAVIISFVMIKALSSQKSEEVYKTVQLAPKPAPLVIFPMDEFKVNTADLDEPHFIRLKLSLAYDEKNKKLATELPMRSKQFRDIILQILNSKEKQDIDEQIEKERLKDEIKKAINNVLTSGEIEDVYYEDFIIS